VKKILDGANPADLPVERPTLIEMSLNLKTAKVRGIAVPGVLQARRPRDRVIPPKPANCCYSRVNAGGPAPSWLH
jgi:hypothetical protein